MHPIDWRYWATMAGVAIWVGIRDAEHEPILRRVAKTSASALLAYGAGPEVAPYLGGSEIAATVALMAFGLLALDVLSGLVSDRDFIRDMLRRKLGGGRD